MPEIHLTRGQKAIVDQEDYQKLVINNWYAAKTPNTFYAARRGPRDKNGKRLTFYMHREIVGLKPYPLDEARSETDHKDRNGLNNTRANLSIVTHKENAQNRDQRRMADRICENCSCQYHPSNRKAKYCSLRCFGQANIRNRML